MGSATSRGLRVALIVLLSFTTLWVAAVNALLRTGALRELTGELPERFKLGYAHALSPLPGWVLVDGLTVRAQSDTVQLSLSVEEASLWIDPLALMERRLHILRAEGEGVVFRVRPRVDAADALPERASAWPPIDGLYNPPDPDPELIYPPPDPFAVDIDRMRLSRIHELWINEVRFEGDATLVSDLDLLPRSRVAVEALHLDVTGGRAEIASADALDAVSGQVDLHIEPLDLAAKLGGDALGRFSGRVNLTGQVASPAFLDYYLRGAPWLHIEGGSGPLDVDVLVTDGELAAGSHLSLRPEWIGADIADYRASGSGEARWDVEAGTVPQSILSVTLDDYRLKRDGDPRPSLRGGGLSVVATSSELTLPDAFGTLEVRLDVPAARLDDVTLLDRYLPQGSGAHLIGGEGRLSGHFQASSEDQRGQGGLSLTLEDLAVKLGDVQVQGDLDLKIKLKVPDLTRGHFVLGGSRLELKALGVAEGGPVPAADRQWWANADLSAGEIRVGAPIFLKLTGDARLKDSAPIAELFIARGDLPRWAQGPLDREDLSATFDVHVGDDRLELRALHAVDDALQLDARLTRDADTSHGALLIQSENLAVGVELADDERHLKLRDARGWFKGGAATAAP